MFYELDVSVYYNRLEHLEENWNTLIPLFMNFNLTDFDEVTEVSKKIYEYYIGDGHLTLENFPKLVQVTSAIR